MKYYSIDVCVSCEKQLTTSEQMLSNGTCVYCGNTNESTITSTRKVIMKKVRVNPFWKFWKKQFRRIKVQ